VLHSPRRQIALPFRFLRAGCVRRQGSAQRECARERQHPYALRGELLDKKSHKESIASLAFERRGTGAAIPRNGFQTANPHSRTYPLLIHPKVSSFIFV
jgi:hypothetical protein